jgi:hypothetical protein
MVALGAPANWVAASYGWWSLDLLRIENGILVERSDDARSSLLSNSLLHLRADSSIQDSR